MKYLIRLGDPDSRFKGKRKDYIYAESQEKAIEYAEQKWGEQVKDAIRIDTSGLRDHDVSKTDKINRLRRIEHASMVAFAKAAPQNRS